MSTSTVTYGGRGPMVLGITWMETGLASMLIILRAKSASIRPRRSNSNIGLSGIYRLRWDFVWVIVAYAMALASQIALTLSVRYGLGNHQSLIPHENLVKLNLWSWIAQVISILDLLPARIAVSAFLILLQGGTAHRSRAFFWLIGFAQAAMYFVSVGLIFRQCSPIARLWNPSIPGTCHGIGRSAITGYMAGGIGAACDFLLAAYPIFIVRQIQHMKRSTKIGLCLIMGGGVIAGSAAIVKGISIKNITNIQDNTYAMASLNIWVFTEMWFVIIFGSIPTLRRVFVQFSQDIGNAILHRHPNQRGQTDQFENWAQLGEAAGCGSGEGMLCYGSAGSTPGADGHSDVESSMMRDRESRQFGERGIVVTSRTTVVSETSCDPNLGRTKEFE